MEEWVKISDLRFTNPTIASRFSVFPDLALADAVAQIQKGSLKPLEKFTKVTVHEDKEGVLWCENNRTLYVLRMAGVTQIKAKIIRNKNDYLARFHGDEEKEQRKDRNFLPKIRGESEVRSALPLVSGRVDSGSSSSDVRFEEDSGSVVPGLLAAASGALLAGYASWKLYKSAQSDQKK